MTTAYPFEGATSEQLLPRLTIGVARTGHLIALKVLSRDDIERPQDVADLRALRRTASADNLALARDSVALITNRGFHRGRSLGAGLEELIAAVTPAK